MTLQFFLGVTTGIVASILYVVACLVIRWIKQGGPGEA